MSSIGEILNSSRHWSVIQFGMCACVLILTCMHIQQIVDGMFVLLETVDRTLLIKDDALKGRKYEFNEIFNCLIQIILTVMRMLNSSLFSYPHDTSAKEIEILEYMLE
jgi:hypothetical protein